MCIAIPMVARCTSFADDLYMDQGRVSSRAALLLRSTERHPSDPRCVFSLITSFQQLVVGEGVVPPHLFTTYHYQSFTSTHNTHPTTCVSTTQPIPQTHAAAPLSRGQISIRNKMSQAAPPCEHSRRAFTNLPLTRPTNESRFSLSKL